jgi:hypothetical protein
MIKSFLKPASEGAPIPPVVLFGITDENIDLLREGRPIKCALRAEMGPELPDITIAICWGASTEDIVASLRSSARFDNDTREVVIPNTGHEH